ncbi:hypothetical protein AURDEDRAFT_115349 [Auricularia subglabra TFB-10046 SS5]|nr:hypothetical protein AURDEDRAFT_115349 [Auricularia subglabra TFB-10046 SS5]
MMRFETPRLVIRSAKPSDEAWIYSVKGDARVNKYQLYGQPKGKADAMTFGNGYIRDRVPLLSGHKRTGAVERMRYVFAITPKADAIPKPESNAIPRVKGHPAHTPLPHEDDVYIGNIAFELEPIAEVIAGRNYGGLGGGPQALRVPPDELFIWPDVESAGVRKELDGWAALLFYEIAPQYWGQGLMNEAMLAVSDFIFYELGLGYMAIDPQVANKSSISLAKKFPDMEYASTITCRSNFTIKQHVFTVSRADYLKRFGPPPVLPAGTKGCSYCYNPRAFARGEGETCSRCRKRWYCSLECRAADWEAADGHGVRCA